ncbi:glycosyltransferase family 2 protein [Prosthecomicrobium sp. N25]|uniref:glycosyltransferase family 2 protein n=1 Tax=Prosthecomicrobium sp. N25 TaxID=3129254 RepID=UPI0030769349
MRNRAARAYSGTMERGSTGVAPPGTAQATLVARRQVEAGPDGGWTATGFEPLLTFDLGAEQRPGWYRVEVVVRAERQVQVRVLPGFGGVLDPDRSSVLRRRPGDRFGGTFRAPEPFRLVGLEPARTPGPFRLQDLAVQRMSAGAVAAMALAGARRAAGRGPAALLRFVAAAASTVLRPGRFETFQPAAALVGAADDAAARYAAWIERHEPGLARDPARAPGPGVGIAVLVPCDGRTDPDRLAATLGSLAEMTEPADEVVVAAPEGSAGAEAARVRGLKVVTTAPGTTAGAAAAAALAPSRASHVVVLAPGDLARPRLAAAFRAALAREPGLAAAFGDEDRIDADGRRRDPRFKPAFSPDFLRSGPVLGRPVLHSRTVLEATGGIAAGPAGAEDYDLALRAGESGRPVVRVAEVLVSRPDPFPGWSPADGAAAAAAGAAALRAHLARVGLAAAVEPDSPAAGVDGPRFRVRPLVPEPAPLVSILVPTRDRLDLLAPCIASLLGRTDWPALEILILDNGSAEPATLAWFAEAGRDPRIRVLPCPGPFDFAAINNRGAEAAAGEVLVLLNNDVEAVEAGWLAEMACLALRPDVGPVGARLLYPDGTVQHGGVLAGMHGLAGHMDVGARAEDAGYLGRLRAVSDVAAVTGACLAVRRSVWRDLGGLDCAFPVAFNDLDFCFRARAAGLRCLFAGHAVLLHRESASRGPDRDPERRARYRVEAAAFKARWGAEIADDPFVSPHLDRAAGLWTARP